MNEPVEQMDFFELLRRLEADGLLFGHGGRPDREPARLGQELRFGFAVRDVAALQPARDGAPARVTVSVIGLLGPEGPLPLHLSRWVLDRLSQRWFAAGIDGATADSTFLDFANMMQHRMIALYYRAWADQTPSVQAERTKGGRVRALAEALAGTGADRLAPVKLGQAAALGHQVLGPERLTGLLRAALGVQVQVEEFVGTWVALPERLQTRLGRAHAGLGQGAAVGPRIFTRQNRILLHLGPLGMLEYEAFLPGGPRLAALRLALLHAMGEQLDVDVRLLLRRTEVPSARIGTSRLGCTAWLSPKRDADAGDLRMRAVVGLAAEGTRAAA
jgi:type VI secretion system protein ImpH